MSKRLTESDIIFDPASNVDTFGRVFRYENRVFRAVRPAATDLCKTLLEHTKNWEAFGLVSTWLADIELEGYPMVLEHKKIQFQSYCTEWLPEMLRDAAVTLITLNKRLVADGFATKDSHPWNIFFDYTRPVFIDFGSIVPLETAALDFWHEEFTNHIWMPLCMFAAGRTQQAYEYMQLAHSGDERIGSRIALSKPAHHWFRDSLSVRVAKPARPSDYFDWMLRRVEQLAFPEVKMKWSEYDQRAKDFKSPDTFEPKQRAVYNVLMSLDKKGTLLDIGSNHGWYSLMAEYAGFRVLAVDPDIPSLNKLYAAIRGKSLAILPLMADFVRPTPAFGNEKCSFPSLLERASCDVAMALALVHHLVFSSGLDFRQIAERIASLARAQALVEFVPKDDIHVREWDQTGKEWYTEDNFVAAFLEHFSKVETYNSSPQPRKIFLFTK